MTGFRITSPCRTSAVAVYGDQRGGHFKVFEWRGCTFPYTAHYYGGDGLGVLIGAAGEGKTPDEAVRTLWSRLHERDCV